MIQLFKASFFATFTYLLVFGSLGLVSILIPYPYFSSFLTVSAIVAVFLFTLVFSSLYPRYLFLLLFILILGFLTAYFPLGLPMSDDLASCRRFACSSLQKDLTNSYFLVRGIPFIWQGYASRPLLTNPYLVVAPLSDLNRYQGSWWQPAAYWPNLLLNIVVITLPSVFYLLLRLLFVPPKH
jgi:hypothetical protein